ncbi:MAG: AI-2E family transporter [Bacteroidetes bacterium]|jgi:predicted PurR-regulated permease PerM|nr:AI-2E family transporter [Bacteroidota bacterium]
MNRITRYIIIAVIAAIVGFILWYFQHIVAYILISGVLSLVGRPIVDMMGQIRINQRKIALGLRALSALIILWLIFFTFFRIFIPLVANEAYALSNLDVNKAVESLEVPIDRFEQLVNKFFVSDSSFSLEDYLTQKIISVLDISILSNFVGSLASVLGNIFVAIFAISFITFFFLKDENLFSNAILAFVPDHEVSQVKHALKSTRRLLMRYFIGIGGQITGIIILVTAGLSIVGIEFSRALVMGLIAGIMNVIPYLGPVLGTTIGLVLGIAGNLDLNFYDELVPLTIYMVLVFITVQLIDNTLFQPLIYSSSVNAHPLEIFLVIMIAASLAGIAGMILAIPTYTILRVFAKEFFSEFKIVKKLTRNIE